MVEWHQTFHDAFWLPAEETAAAQADFLFRALRLRRCQSVLDCPCGSGRIAAQLARRGCQVTGVDFKPRFVRDARKRLARERLRGDFVVGDMRRIEFDGEFDAAFNWSGSFGYFDEAGNLQTLQRLAAAVRRGGRVLIDQPNRQWILRHFQPSFARGRIITRNRWDAANKRMISVWRTTRAGRTIQSTMSIRLYTLAEMKKMLAMCGLEFARAYGNAQGDAYSPASRRLIIVAGKTANLHR